MLSSVAFPQNRHWEGRIFSSGRNEITLRVHRETSRRTQSKYAWLKYMQAVRHGEVGGRHLQSCYNLH
jgi:hypothetical protein